MLGIEMNQFEEASRPVIYEYDDAEFVYWGKGSSFLIANSRNYYWVTAAHVLSNMGGCAGSLRIFPSDGSKIALPFNEQYTVNKGTADDEDYKDVFMLRIDLTRFDASGDAPLVAQDLERGLLSASELKPDDELWIIGYPAESNFIDYDCSKISNTRSVLRAIYVGNSTSIHCHELRVETSVKIESYDGLSGSPVYYMKRLEREGEATVYPLLVGMLLRGSASSRTAHFVSSDVLSNIVSLAGSMPNKRVEADAQMQHAAHP
jgi:hypothetical protein